MTVSTTRPAIPAGLVAGGVVAIARRLDPDNALDVAGALAEGGVRAFEITLNEPVAHAYRAIAAVAGGSRRNGLAIGAGTVLSIAAARNAVDAGATFLVMPHTDADLDRLGGRARDPGTPRRSDPDRGPGRLASGRGGREALPGLGPRPELHPRVRGPVPRHPGRADRRCHGRIGRLVHRGRRRSPSGWAAGSSATAIRPA